MSCIILGIDPGIADTGYGLVEKVQAGKVKCLCYGSIQTSSKLKMEERLEILYRELNKVIKKYKPNAVSIERLFFNKNVKTALIVGQARGVALLACQQNNLPVEEFTPLQIKQSVSAYGKASKIQVQKMVKLLLNLKELPRPDDAADALAAAICLASLNIKKLYGQK